MSRKTVKDTTGCFSQGRRPEWWLSLSRGKINRNWAGELPAESDASIESHGPVHLTMWRSG